MKLINQKITFFNEYKEEERTEQKENSVEEAPVIEMEDNLITLSSIKNWLTINKFYVWLVAVLPISALTPGEFMVFKLVTLILQLTCFGIMCWIGWRGIFNRFF